jgi:hypothetical protein
MDTTEIRELAESMTRTYGKARALSLAERYALSANTRHDIFMHDKWAAVAAVLSKALESEQRTLTSSV